MRDNETTTPAIVPRFSEMFRFADDSTLDEHVRELRAEAFAYGFNLDIRVFAGPIPPSEKAELVAGITPPPERAQEILHGLLSKHYLALCKAVNDARRGRGEKSLGDPVALGKRQAAFRKAYYGRLRDSEKSRRIVDLLRAWHGRQTTEQWNKAEAERLENRIRLTLLSPLLNAVRALDTEFFEILARAIRMLETRIRSSKDSTIGTGDMDLDLWLLEYGMRIAGTPTHTVRELNEQFVSKFRSISDKKLHERLHELGIPHKDEPRGKAAPAYGNVLKLPPQRRKKGKF